MIYEYNNYKKILDKIYNIIISNLVILYPNKRKNHLYNKYK